MNDITDEMQLFSQSVIFQNFLNNEETLQSPTNIHRYQGHYIATLLENTVKNGDE